MTPTAPATRRLFSFVGGATGPWLILEASCLLGEGLPAATRLSVTAEPTATERTGAAWELQGITSNERYVQRDEKSALAGRQEGLGRVASTHAALIPIRKTAAWWALPQDERRDIFVAQSHHIGIGMKYLPAVARRLHHCRDLATNPPFDFLTWFEYAPADASAFDELLHALRTSPEWTFVDRELDFRLIRVQP